MKYYSIGEASRRIGVTIQTLKNWDGKGVLETVLKKAISESEAQENG